MILEEIRMIGVVKMCGSIEHYINDYQSRYILQSLKVLLSSFLQPSRNYRVFVPIYSALLWCVVDKGGATMCSTQVYCHHDSMKQLAPLISMETLK